MNKLHQKLHLQHHRHTGKLLHHRHTSYRGLAVVFLLAGGLMLGVNILGHAAADSLTVYGTAPVAIPSVPAIITMPADGSSITAGSVLVAGSCPLISPQVVVAVEVDGNRAGSGMCDSGNDFSVPISLGTGSHSVVARTYTITGDTGPASSPVHISYQVPAPLGSSPGTTNSLEPSAGAPFLYLGASRTITWVGSLNNDAESYQVLIDWGDKTQDTHTVQPGAQQFTHHYGTLQSYNLAVFITSPGGTTREQYAVAAYTTPAGGTGSGSTIASTPASYRTGNTSTIFGLYGLFMTLAAVYAIIWLEAKHHARHELAPQTISRQ